MTMGTLLQDLKFAVRLIPRNPTFTVVAIVTLGLGIGANTAIFSVVNRLSWGLPYENPAQLVAIGGAGPRTLPGIIPRASVYYPNFSRWAAEAKSFSSMAAYDSFEVNIANAGAPPDRVTLMRVSAGYFSTTGVAPLLGRDIQEADCIPGAANVALLEHGQWKNRFGSRADALGQVIHVNGQPTTIVGVMPAGFGETWDTRRISLWLPLQVDRGNPRGAPWVSVLGRMRPEATLDQAKAELDVLMEGLRQDYAEANKDREVRVAQLRDPLLESAGQPLKILFVAVGLVLLIACANVANLLLAQSTRRSREMAVRIALGAPRQRLIRLAMTETILLSLFGGASGLLFADLAIRAINDFAARTRMGLPPIHLDLRVLVFALALSLLTGFVFGLLPALRAAATNPNTGLKEESGRAVSGSRHRLRSVLVITEVALALVLLIGAGLLIKSLRQLLDVNPGFETQGVITMQVSLTETEYDSNWRVNRFYEEVLAEVSALPGVSSAGLTSVLPLTGFERMTGLFKDGQIFQSREEAIKNAIHVPYRSASVDYFKTMGIGLRAGRYFTEADTAESEPVLVISESMARRFYPDQNPIGETLVGEGAKWKIVGIAGDILHRNLDNPALRDIYFPSAQKPSPEMTLVVRSAMPESALTEAVRTAVQGVDPTQPVFNVRTMSEVLMNRIAARRLILSLMLAFAALAFLLAAMGIYGVVSCMANERTREIGIRMAMGANPSDVISMVLRQGLRLALVGAALGLLAAFWLTRFLASQLFGVSTTDLWTFALCGGSLLAVSLIAGVIPARRATKVDPVVSLRAE
jgi:putative ABC transport system permease protein